MSEKGFENEKPVVSLGHLSGFTSSIHRFDEVKPLR